MLHHHERYDGKGYPQGLKGKEIDLGARIYAVADVLDALTSNRLSRAAMCFEDAMKEIEEWRDILESYSVRRLSQLLISTSERASRLRQSNPLFAVLKSDERSRLLDGLGGDK